MSQYAYAAVAYLKITDKTGSFKTSIVMAKSRVAPQATIPRLELSAAVTGARIYEKIINELSLSETTAYFWTDSMCVLRYIQNTRSSFKIFVANRLEIIHNITDSDRWFYAPTKLNPADCDDSLPPGVFKKRDLCSRRFWRKANVIADCFLRRWLIEYLPTLQTRSKWHDAQQNLKNGDLVLVSDEQVHR